jgi:hypothetical protein
MPLGTTLSRPRSASPLVSLFVGTFRFERGPLTHAGGKNSARQVTGMLASRTGRIDDGDDLVAIRFVNAREAAARQPAAPKSTSDSHCKVLRPQARPGGLASVA